LSERYKEDLISEIPEVDQYFGTSELPSLLKVLGADYKHELLGERIKTTPFNYSYLKISEGCDRPCSFCAIPLMRGKHLSTPIEDLVLQATKLAEKGIKELILIAQDLTYYGLDLYKKRNLVGLLKELVKIQGIEWIRLHYAFPSGFPIEVLTLMKNEPKICNYLDIPLQHVSDKILKSMKRGINYKKTTELVNEFRKIVPNISIRTTFIVGYPGETSKDFKLLLNWIKKMKFERLGCFKYSHEENTSAYELEDDVSEKIKNNRLSKIMEAQRLISFNFNQKLIGRKLKCIIDRKEGKYFVGRTEMDSPDVDNEVLVDASRFYLKQGEFYDLLITEVSDYDLFAIPC
jgi:ribosomal protein S12 methylthiotransferase